MHRFNKDVATTLARRASQNGTPPHSPRLFDPSSLALAWRQAAWALGKINSSRNLVNRVQLLLFCCPLLLHPHQTIARTLDESLALSDLNRQKPLLGLLGGLPRALLPTTGLLLTRCRPKLRWRSPTAAPSCVLLPEPPRDWRPVCPAHVAISVVPEVSETSKLATGHLAATTKTKTATAALTTAPPLDAAHE